MGDVEEFLSSAVGEGQTESGSDAGEKRGPGRPPGPPDVERHDEWLEKVGPLKLNSMHRVLMYRLLTGMKQKDAAEELGISPARVAQLMASELFAAEMSRMREQITEKFVENEADVVKHCRAKLMEMAVSATKEIETLMLSAESEQVRGKMAESVLDRVGLKAVERVEQSISVTVPEGLHDALQASLAEMRKKKE